MTFMDFFNAFWCGFVFCCLIVFLVAEHYRKRDKA